MFKLLGKAIAGMGTGFAAVILVFLMLAVWVTFGAMFWGWLIMVIMGASGHAWMGYGTAFLWGYIPAILTGS